MAENIIEDPDELEDKIDELWEKQRKQVQEA